ASGTVLVKDLGPGGISDSSQYSRILVNVNGTLFFPASDATGRPQLWKSDGTASGTVLVKNMVAANLTNVNGTVFFAGDDGTTGLEFWKSDGTTAGTVLVKDIYSGSSSSNYHYYHNHQHTRTLNSSSPDNLTNLNGTLYFTATEAKHGTELW